MTSRTRRSPVFTKGLGALSHRPAGFVPLIIAILTAAVLFAMPAAASALPPHVVTTDTVTIDACAMCHRAHSANADVPYQTDASLVPTGNSLLIASEPERGDVSLCYVCHGVAALGASVDVETSFSMESTHVLAPASSAYGSSPKMCSSCHDAHGTARTASGTPYPSLLRAFSDPTTEVNSGEEYCVVCHAAAPASRFESITVYRQTGHYTAMPVPASGTKIRCSNCHSSHGSSIRPLIGQTVYPPAAPATTTVDANDRRQCLACHDTDQGTWAGTVAYGAGSHAESVKVVPALGAWELPGATRRVGECQVCHAPMGKAGAGGAAIPKLGERAGRAMCDDCHKAGGKADTDLASLAYPSVTESAQPELLAVYGPSANTTDYARISVYSRELSGADPRPLMGPREYSIPEATSTAAVGDLDDDGQAELLVAHASQSKLKLFQRDALRGLSTSVAAWDIPVGIRPDAIAIGRWVGDSGSSVENQVAVVDTVNGRMRIYRWDGAALDPIWPVGGPYVFAGTSAPTGLASGDVTGTGLSDIAVTDAGTQELRILTQDGVDSSAMIENTSTTQPGPRGPSIGDVWSNPLGKNEIVVCNTLASTATVSLFAGDGTKLEDYEADPGTGDGVPWASVVANVLPGTGGGSGREVAVALRSESGTSAVNVFTQVADPGVGLDPIPQWYMTDMLYRTGSIAAGDVQGDGTIDLVVGNAGAWDKAAGMVPPSVQVFRSSGGGVLNPAVTRTLLAGGTELAGGAPALAIADFGAVLPSRHPIDEANAGSHVSTETSDFTRHVTCSDCHDVHQANDSAATAPNIAGRLLGSWGISVTNNAPGDAPTFGEARMSVYQYETCFKCHSASIALANRPDIASLVSTRNASVHAIEAPSTSSVVRPGTFVSGADENSRVLYCTDCHGNATATEATGTHRSTSAPLLSSPFLGRATGDASALCYDCHKRSVYYTGADDLAGTGSRFFEGSAVATSSLHALHVRDWNGTAVGLGFGCLTCHNSHGSTDLPHLLRGDVGYTVTGADAGACANACHTASHAYDGS